MIGAFADLDVLPAYRPAWIRFVEFAFSGTVVPIANRVGTGGETTAAYCRDRGDMGYPLVPVTDERPEATALENLEKIREVLNPSMSDLARALKLSRQSLYDWMGGGSIAAENAKKLRDLAGVAELFEKEGLRASNQLLRREIDGKSFYDRVRSGESAKIAGHLLVSIVRRETEQRDALNKRLKNRPPLTISVEEFGTPHLTEMD